MFKEQIDQNIQILPKKKENLFYKDDKTKTCKEK
jgi:hypothetical protein